MAGQRKPFAFVPPLVLAGLAVAMAMLIFTRRGDHHPARPELDYKANQIRELVNVADAAELIGNWKGARKALEMAARLDPQDNIVRGRLDEAIAEEKREALVAQAAEANAKNRSAEEAEALAAARKIREDAETRKLEIQARVATLTKRGDTARQEGNLELATDCYQQALKLAPSEPARRALKEIADAASHRYVDDSPRTAAGLVAEGDTLLEAKKVRSAAEKFREALKLGANPDATSKLQTAEAYQAQGKMHYLTAVAAAQKKDWLAAKAALDLAALFDAENEDVGKLRAEIRKLEREGEMASIEETVVKVGGQDVKVAPIWIDRTEVSEGQWAAYLRAQGLPLPRAWAGGKPLEDGKLPMMGVSALEAEQYAKWAGKRLPTEAEWLAAAGAADGRKYPWGAEWTKDIANANSKGPRAVGAVTANSSPCGALDMAGNVAEWTATKGEKGRVVKGGSFLFPETACELTWRWEESEDLGIAGIGFRCVADK